MATETKKLSALTEVITVNDNDYLLIVQNGDSKKVQAGKLKGAKNLSEKYVDLVSTDNTDKKFRMILRDDGEPIVYPIEVFTAEGWKQGDNLNVPFKTAAGSGMAKVATADIETLFINQMYGGGTGTAGTVETSVSHSFVELYNNSEVDINLKGLYLNYKAKSGTWQSLPLRGIIPAHCSFLVRGGAHYNINSDLVRLKIKDYDQSWNIQFSDEGFSMYLSIGECTEETPIKFTRSSTDNKIISANQQWVDVIGAGGLTSEQTVPLYDGAKFIMGMSRNTAVRRLTFFNNDNSLADCEIIDYKTCNVDAYRPRCTKDGVWKENVTETQIKSDIPNIVNMSFGKDEFTRTFTWQSTDFDKGFLKYRKEGDKEWTKVETESDVISQYDKQVQVHHVIIRNLTPGTYYYKVGTTGYYSDEEAFDVKDYSTNGFKFLWTTDQQGWNGFEYDMWDEAFKGIKHYEYTNGVPNFDFHMNTGDMSQNGNRYFEWKYYFDYADDTVKNMPHVCTIGNNDLVEKKYGYVFDYYNTLDDAPRLADMSPYDKFATTGYGSPAEERNEKMVSTCSYTLGGFCHFINLNSNTEYMYEGLNTDQFLTKECAFLEKDLQEVAAKRASGEIKWVIIYMHLSPMTIVRTKRLQRFIPIIEKYKVDLVLCGHNHTYSRSIPVYSGYMGDIAYDGKGKYTTSPYNDYVTKVSTGSSELLLVDETRSDGSDINRKPDKVNGTHYIMLQAAGYKLSGKEKAIIFSESQIDAKHMARNWEEDPNGATTVLRPWWYSYAGKLPVQPTYAMLNVTPEQIEYTGYYFTDLSVKDPDTGLVIQPKFDSTKNGRAQFDHLVITYAERHPSETKSDKATE